MELTRRVTAQDQATTKYQHIPFTVDPSWSSFEVTLIADQVDGLVLDLGCAGPNGLRGWSGGARTSFIITETDATPGYQPGLTAGQWNVIVGLHRVPAEGANFTVRVDSPARNHIDHGPCPRPLDGPQRGSERGLPAPDGLTWFAGDPHNHTIHSDGALSIAELANEGLASGLDFLGCTEHNTISHHRFLPEVSAEYGITLLPGQEVTTHLGHANAWGNIDVIDFRQHGNTWNKQTVDQGGFLTINHPISDDCSWLYDSDDVAGVEIFHSTWYKQLHETSILAWQRLFQHTHHGSPILIGGGDFHRTNTPLRPGLPTTWVAAEDNSVEAILEGMRAGRTAMTASYQKISDHEYRPNLSGPILVRDDETMTAIDADGCTVIDLRGERRVLTSNEESFTAPRQAGPYRIEQNGRTVALTG